MRLLSPPQRKQHPPPGSVWSLRGPASVRFNTGLHRGTTKDAETPLLSRHPRFQFLFLKTI